MTYALNLSDAARASLAALPFDLQETVWDLLDRIVADPGDPGRRTRLSASVHRVFHRGPGGGEAGVELALGVDHDARVVHLLGVKLAE